MTGITRTMRSLLHAARQRLRAFESDARGVAAVEFALLLVPMMTLFLGSIEVSQGVGASRKATLISHTVADLAAQAKSITDADRDNIFNAAKAVLAPYSSTQLKIVMSSVNIDANKKATILWSDGYNTQARVLGDVVTTQVPAALLTASTTLIWAEVSYAYTPAVGYVLSGTLNLKDSIFMRPRLVSSVCRGASCPTS